MLTPDYRRSICSTNSCLVVAAVTLRRVLERDVLSEALRRGVRDLLARRVSGVGTAAVAVWRSSTPTCTLLTSAAVNAFDMDTSV
jgi:hypothetical protein